MFERFDHAEDLRDYVTELETIVKAPPGTYVRSFLIKRGARKLRATIISDGGEVAEMSVSSSVVLGAPDKCSNREVQYIAKVLKLRREDFGVSLFLRPRSPIRAWQIRLVV